MSRKVHADAEVEVLVPVRVKVGLIIRADEDANIAQAINRWAQRRPYSKADVEINEWSIEKVGNYDGDDPADMLTEAVTDLIDLDQGKITILLGRVVDSK